MSQCAQCRCAENFSAMIGARVVGVTPHGDVAVADLERGLERLDEARAILGA